MNVALWKTSVIKPLYGWLSATCKCRTTYILLVLLITSTQYLLSQSLNLGIPKINNYSKLQYNGGIQSWEAEILPNGKLLFANNKGLIEYNGNQWNLYSLPKKTICRSISVDYKGRIFAGGQDEIGYFLPDSTGKLQFNSIRKSIPEPHKNLTDVWDLVSYGNKTYFRSNGNLYIYNEDESIDCISEFLNPTILTKTNDGIWFHVFGKGIYKLDGRNYSLIENSKEIADYTVTSITEVGRNEYLVSTLKNGLVKLDYAGINFLNLPYNSFLEKNRINDIIKLPNEQFIISTGRAGILILDSKLKAINHINKSKGLQSNEINSLVVDQNNDLWLGSSFGIDQVLFSDGIKKFFPDQGKEGSIYDIQEYKGKLFFATNDGLYFIDKKDYYNPFKPFDFQFVENTLGQVWGLDLVEDELFIGHSEGAFLLKENRAIKFSKEEGAWKFIKIGADKIAVGTYFGIDLYNKTPYGYSLYRHIEGFEESSRIMEIDDQGFIWISHPYRGVFRINPFTQDQQEVLQQFGIDDGLPSSLLNYVFKINHEIYVTGETGIYKYDQKIKSFQLDPEFNQYIDSTKNVRRLFEYINGEIWYIAEHEFGRFIPGERVGKEGYFHQKWNDIHNEMIGGFENIFVDRDKNLFVASDKGVITLDYATPEKRDTLICNIDAVRLTQLNNKVIFHGYYNQNESITFNQSSENVYSFDPEISDIKFHFSSNILDETSFNSYSYYLEGYDEDWSDWSTNLEKEYTQLDHGNYTFHVKTRDSNNNSSEASHFDFSIKPKWYKTNIAKLVWVILSLGLLWLLFFFNRRKYAKETVYLRNEQEKTKEEIEKLKNEKLQSEIAFRDKELASSTMHLVQKNETITKLRVDLEALQKEVDDKKVKKDIRKILSTINDDNRLEDEWENFAFYFDQVHTNFLKRLHKNFPVLTNKDMKLAAYLRMNLNTKEIAPLLNISVRGVEISRYRLRKKMELNSETNLNEFMINY